jgi:hypothetical protein
MIRLIPNDLPSLWGMMVFAVASLDRRLGVEFDFAIAIRPFAGPASFIDKL